MTLWPRFDSQQAHEFAAIHITIALARAVDAVALPSNLFDTNEIFINKKHNLLIFEYRIELNSLSENG